MYQRKQTLVISTSEDKHSMIQRIQSLYLLLSLIIGAACLCLPIGKVFLTGVCVPFTNLGLLENHSTWVLFALLLTVVIINGVTILLFKFRALQMRLTIFSILLLIGWYGLLGFFAYNMQESLRPTVWASIPFAMIVLNYLSFRGVLKDEMLIRSLDRLR